ncbi:MAG TPA: hypothetical protein VIY48_08010 [Candidatus Paceibacterota bacterium]
MILNALKLVEGAVSTQDLIPALTHICIYAGRLQGGNGRVAIDTACPQLDFDAVVPAEKFVKALSSCRGEPVLKLEGSRLTVRDRRFRATISLLPNESYLRAEPPQGEPVTPQEMLPALRKLAPFISTDASRPWSCSLLAYAGYLYATNNVVLARVPFAWSDEKLAIPEAAVQEMLRLDQEPQAIHITLNAAWVRYANCWMKVQLLQDPWPIEALSKLIERMQTIELDTLPEGLLDDVQTLKPFFPDEKLPVVLTGPEGVSTMDGAHSAAIATTALPKNAFRIESLSLVLGTATHANLTTSPCPWRGDGIEGFLSAVHI